MQKRQKLPYYIAMHVLQSAFSSCGRKVLPSRVLALQFRFAGLQLAVCPWLCS